MRTRIGIVLLVCFVPALRGADEENPLKKPKVGDWTEYRMTGPSMDGKTRLTIIAKDDKEVTYEVTGKISFNGKEMAVPVQKKTIDLTKPYDPIVAANLARTGTKIETVGEGTEKVTIGGKEYDTKWTKLKATTTVGDVTLFPNTRCGSSRACPYPGWCMDTSTSGTDTRVELVGTGSK